MDARPGAAAAAAAPRMLLLLVSNDARDAIHRSAHRGCPSTSISSTDGVGFLQICTAPSIKIEHLLAKKGKEISQLAQIFYLM
uniref:Uncharacterized protein n=1 Tax=Arundo donax TaxID=35708 RepID=A0A0A9CKR7_ARUDO